MKISGGPSVTNQQCVDACSAAGFNLAGTQGGDTCRCDIDFQYAPILEPASECSTPCTGNSNEDCGGIRKMTVYRRNSLVANIPLITGWTLLNGTGTY